MHKITNAIRYQYAIVNLILVQSMAVLEAGPDGDLSTDPKGSTDLNELRTSSLVTLIPPDLILPYKNETLANGISLLMLCISDLRLA